MSYETLMYIGLGIGGVFFFLSVILFFALKIPAVISELTGRTARREVAAILSRERNADGRSASSHKTEKLRKGIWPFGRKAKNTEELLERGREALKDRQAKGTVSYSSEFPQTENDNDSTIPLAENQTPGSWEDGSTVPLDRSQAPGGWQDDSTIPLAENQTSGYWGGDDTVSLEGNLVSGHWGSDTSYPDINELSGFHEQDRTVALFADQPTEDQKKDKYHETMALRKRQSTVPTKDAVLRKDVGHGRTEVRHDTARLNDMAFDQLRWSEAPLKKPDVYIEDRIIVVHTDELIDKR